MAHRMEGPPPEHAISLVLQPFKVRREPGEHLAGVTDGELLELVGERAEVGSCGVLVRTGDIGATMANIATTEMSAFGVDAPRGISGR